MHVSGPIDDVLLKEAPRSDQSVNSALVKLASANDACWNCASASNRVELKREKPEKAALLKRAFPEILAREKSTGPENDAASKLASPRNVAAEKMAGSSKRAPRNSA
ncbi:hypothetical protein GCM10010321_88350 [Streptomyces chartreusis]|nr:hypothetical protein GCM10010321_88350 [Streptomyces chartreusis]